LLNIKPKYPSTSAKISKYFVRENGSKVSNLLEYLRLINLKRTLFDLAGTKNSSWTDRPQKSGRFEIKWF
jgi:hypothetical protein